MVSYFIQLFNDSLPEAIGGLSVAAILAGLGLVYRRLRHQHSKANHLKQLDRLNGVIDITSNLNRVNRVFYSRRFTSTPYLNLKLINTYGDLEVLEQRPDGFEFTVSIQSRVRDSRELPPLPGLLDPEVVWEAEGQFQVDLTGKLIGRARVK